MKKIIHDIPPMYYGNPSAVCYIGSVMRLLEHLGDPIAEDELFALSGAGLFWAWKKPSDCDEVSIDSLIPQRIFDALGYESEYYTDSIKPGTVPDAITVGVWPLPEGNYDPALSGCEIPPGVCLYGLFDAAYKAIPAPVHIEGYRRVESLAELKGKTYLILSASSGFDYVLVSEDELATADASYSKEFYFDKIRQSIDARHPVIGFGITAKHPYTCLIVGYDENGLYTRAFWAPNGEPHDSEEYFYSTDWYKNCAGIQIVGEKTHERLTGEAAYNRIDDWAIHFRNKESTISNNQTILMDRDAFNEMRNWLLDDGEWQTDEQLRENEQWLYQMGIMLLKHYRWNLLSYLKRLDEQYPGVVNPPAIKALESMDALIPRDGEYWNAPLAKAVDPALADFTVMRDKSMRKKVAEYIGELEMYNNSIQWALFMPSYVKRQISGFELKSFEYVNMPAMRFIGRETVEEQKDEVFRILDGMPEHASGFDHDILFMHHYGLTVDHPWHGVWGRFMKAEAPVPEGFLSFDFIPDDNGRAGLPYISRFAFAEYDGDWDALHKNEGFDSDAMYDVTRNIVLGDDAGIPYPEKYWTAEVFFENGKNGANSHAGYLFSVVTAGIRMPPPDTAQLIAETSASVYKIHEIDLKTLVPATNSTMGLVGDGSGTQTIDFTENGELALRCEGDMDCVQTAESYTLPLKIDITAKTDSTNLRLYYYAGEVIFNWECNENELRLHDICTGKSDTDLKWAKMGSIPKGEYVNASWIITKHGMEIYVDGELRARDDSQKYVELLSIEPFRKINEPVRISAAWGSTVTVKALTVTELCNPEI